jgi:hypothetical protein
MGFLAWFSVWTTPHLNADQAIHILMAERFDVARDAYYWGQDRLGSLLPALGAVLVALGVPSLDALAWVQVGVLLATGLVWLRLLRNQVLGALGFAAILLPIFPFHESVSIGHPYLAQRPRSRQGYSGRSAARAWPSPTRTCRAVGFGTQLAVFGRFSVVLPAQSGGFGAQPPLGQPRGKPRGRHRAHHCEVGCAQAAWFWEVACRSERPGEVH